MTCGESTDVAAADGELAVGGKAVDSRSWALFRPLLKKRMHNFVQNGFQ